MLRRVNAGDTMAGQSSGKLEVMEKLIFWWRGGFRLSAPGTGIRFLPMLNMPPNQVALSAWGVCGHA
jgi:hypothetical protein